MEASLVATIIEELNNIRSYGEGLKILGKFSLVSKGLIRDNEQLFHSIIQKTLGFKEPNIKIKADENRDIILGRSPKSLFYGFFEFKLMSNESYEHSWTYYRVDIDRNDTKLKNYEYNITFVSNNRTKIKFSGIHYFTKDYFLIYKNENLEIYYLRLDNLIISYKLPEMKTFKAIQRDWGLIIVCNFDVVVSIGTLKMENGKYKLTMDIAEYSDYDYSVFGYYGPYYKDVHIDDRSYIEDYFTGTEYALDPIITFPAGHIEQCVNIYPTIDLLYINEICLVYDVKKGKVAWLFYPTSGVTCDSYVIYHNRILDIITGRVLLNLNTPGGSRIILTRKDDDTGYWIWINQN